MLALLLSSVDFLSEPVRFLIAMFSIADVFDLWSLLTLFVDKRILLFDERSGGGFSRSVDGTRFIIDGLFTLEGLENKRRCVKVESMGKFGAVVC